MSRVDLRLRDPWRVDDNYSCRSGGRLDDEDLIALVGRELVGFRLTELLGAGGMAAVFRGENVLDPSIVRALKVVRPELTARPGFAKRFAREAGILESLRHPNVVRFHGVRTSTDGWLVMELELLRGRTLAAIEGRVPVAQALARIADAADGIAAVHALGVVHRDVKPSNLFLTDEGTVKVLDFGIARAFAEGPWSTQLTAPNVVPGTPLYLAPEALAGRELTAAADVYALGVVLYELLAGHHPLAPPGSPPRSPEELYRARLREPTLPPLEDVPAVVRGLLDGALAEKPEARFRDAAAFVTAIRAARAVLVEPGSTEVTARAGPGALLPTVLAEAPPRLPGSVAPTIAVDPPGDENAPAQPAGVMPVLRRDTVIVGLAALGLGALVVAVLAGWWRADAPTTTQAGADDVDASIASDAAPDVALVVAPAVDSGRRERESVVPRVPPVTISPDAGLRATTPVASATRGSDAGPMVVIGPDSRIVTTPACSRARRCCEAIDRATTRTSCNVPELLGTEAAWCSSRVAAWRRRLQEAGRRVPPACESRCDQARRCCDAYGGSRCREELRRLIFVDLGRFDPSRQERTCSSLMDDWRRNMRRTESVPAACIE